MFWFSSLFSRRDLWILGGVALLLRIVYLWLMLDQVPAAELLTLAPDTIQYVNIGSGIAGVGGGDEAAVIFFGPGYGAFLGLLRAPVFVAT